jgi:hypothetical protein
MVYFLIFCLSFLFSTLGGNGLRLPEGGDFGAINVNQAQTLIEAQSLI